MRWICRDLAQGAVGGYGNLNWRQKIISKDACVMKHCPPPACGGRACRHGLNQTPPTTCPDDNQPLSCWRGESAGSAGGEAEAQPVQMTITRCAGGGGGKVETCPNDNQLRRRGSGGIGGVRRRGLLKQQSATVPGMEEGLSYIWGFLWVWRLAVSACGVWDVPLLFF